MRVSTSPAYILGTSSGDVEVTKFFLNGWGISREYQIDLTVTNPAFKIQLGEAVRFLINDFIFHGFVLFVEEIYSDQRHEINIVVNSPLAYYLNHTGTRIYSDLTLLEVLNTILTEAGLQNKIDYEIALKSFSKPLWLQQIQENSLDFFYKLLARYGLVYHYHQTNEGVKCLITDSLTDVVNPNPIELSLNPISGLNGIDELSQFLRQNQVCTQLTERYQYEPEAFKLKTHQDSSIHAYAQGKQVRSGVDDGQQVIDESADSLWVTLQAITVHPGQRVQINTSVTSFPYTVIEMRLTGFTDHALVKREQLSCEVMLSKVCSGSPLINSIKHQPYSLFHSGQIEQHQSAYPNVLTQGEYCVRFLHDQTSDVMSSFQSNKVRNALYCSGNYYGFSFPFQGDTEVLIGYQNGNQQQPIILGALPTFKHPSLVSNQNSSDSLMQSFSGSQFLFNESHEHSILALRSANRLNEFNLTQFRHSAQFLLQSSTGSMEFNALNNIKIQAQDLTYYALENLRIWANESIQFESKDGTALFISETLFTLRSHADLTAHSNKFICRASEKIKLKSTQALTGLAVQQFILQTPKGSQFWHAQSGRIKITARRKLMFVGGVSSMVISPQSIEFKSSAVSLNATSIGGL
ncbi:contractile injection system protein, VgrG/Pvc8 family [Legionella yabuuchiae]|uniref:contractile injection system protein, VgrG/Pvc8 family n=1 Tax=Legionella yabuuchiae TaxID=376727 RepID=UPI0010548B7D|nr:contractile injection system protein, VgrG/Pvc8 family [Legionella yabuuchiae]